MTSNTFMLKFLSVSGFHRHCKLRTPFLFALSSPQHYVANKRLPKVAPRNARERFFTSLELIGESKVYAGIRLLSTFSRVHRKLSWESVKLVSARTLF